MKTIAFRTNIARIGYATAAIIFSSLSVVAPASALTPAQLKVFQYQIYAYDVAINTACGSAVGNGSTTGDIATTASQEANAKIVIGVAKTENLGKEGAYIGLMVAITESSLKRYANSNVPLSLTFPHEAVGHDHDSLGIMQQRISTDWSTISTSPTNGEAVKQLMDPTYNAEAFFGSPAGSDAPRQLSKGLQNVNGWQSMSPWVAAQKVQASGTPDGSNYKVNGDRAQALLTKLWDSSPPVSLPVPLSGGSKTGSGSSVSNSSCTSPCDTSTVDATLTAVRQQVVCRTEAEYNLYKSGTLKAGTDFHKYSQGRDENWCADFASWIYNQAKYPLDSGAKEGNVPRVSTIEDIGGQNKLFHLHAAAGYTPVPGDLAIHYSGGSTSHVNIVTAVKGDKITLIGGNQSGKGFNDTVVSQYDINSSTSDGIHSYVSPE